MGGGVGDIKGDANAWGGLVDWPLREGTEAFGPLPAEGLAEGDCRVGEPGAPPAPPGGAGHDDSGLAMGEGGAS